MDRDGGAEISFDGLFEVRSANEWMAAARKLPTPKRLLGGIWREGELAILFGAKGSGKSVLAMQIADAVSRGVGFGPFGTEAAGQKTLYLDLKLTAKQFGMRYEADEDVPFAEDYEFHENFQRVPVNLHADVPEDCRSFSDYLCRGVAKLVEQHDAKVLIIDNITHLKHSNDVVRDVLPLMRELSRLKKETGLSILVVSQAQKRISRRFITIDDLQSAKILGNFADSVFTIGDGGRGGAYRYIKHLNSRSGEVLYDHSHVPQFRIDKINGNFLGLAHINFLSEKEMYGDYSEQKDWDTIDRIKKMHDGGEETEGKTIREIAEELSMSKTTVHRLLQMWPPVPEKQQPPPPEPYNGWRPEPERYLGEHTDDYLQSIGYPRVWQEDLEAEQAMSGNGDASERVSEPGFGSPPAGGGVAAASADGVVGAATGAFERESEDTFDELLHLDENGLTNEQAMTNLLAQFEDKRPAGKQKHPAFLATLRHDLDGYGRDIWIEKDGHLGKPDIWYEFDSKGVLIRCQRDLCWVTRTRLEE